MKKKIILGIIAILTTCVSCTTPFRYDDTFVINSISNAEKYSRYEYVYEIKHYDVNRGYYGTFKIKSNEKCEIGDTIVFNLK